MTTTNRPLNDAPTLPPAAAGKTPFAQVMRNATALAGVTLKLTFRDKRAAFMSLLFPLFFLFVFGTIFSKAGPSALRQLEPMLVGLSLVTNSFFGQGLVLALQRERGMLRRYRLSPLGSTGLLLGTALAGLGVVAMIAALQLFILKTVYHAPLEFSVPAFIGVALIGACAMSSLGLIIAAVTSTAQEAQLLMQICFMSTLFLSGLTFPLDAFPGWMHRVSVFLPPTHMTSTLTDVLLSHLTVQKDAAPLIALGIMTVAAFVVAARLFRWEKDDPLPRKAKMSALLALAPVLLFGLWQNAHPVKDAPTPTKAAQKR